MSADSQPEDNLDLEHGIIAFAFSESGPLEPPCAVAIRALSIRAAVQSKVSGRRASPRIWDDTGESMLSRDDGVLATGDEDERPPSAWFNAGSV
jgi:hypothetical protein